MASQTEIIKELLEFHLDLEGTTHEDDSLNEDETPKEDFYVDSPRMDVNGIRKSKIWDLIFRADSYEELETIEDNLLKLSDKIKRSTSYNNALSETIASSDIDEYSDNLFEKVLNQSESAYTYPTFKTNYSTLTMYDTFASISNGGVLDFGEISGKTYPAYTFLSIPITSNTKQIDFNLYMQSYDITACLVYYQFYESETKYNITKGLTKAEYETLVSDFITNADGSTQFQIDNTGFPTYSQNALSLEIESEIDGFLVVMFNAPVGKTRYIGWTSTNPSTFDVTDENYTITFKDTCPYWLHTYSTGEKYPVDKTHANFIMKARIEARWQL